MARLRYMFARATWYDRNVPLAYRMLLALALGTFPLGLANAQSTVRDFRLGGSASLISESCIRLTPDRPYVSGSAWFKRPIDLARSFEMRLDLVLGEKDEEGADGIVFVFHPTVQTGFRGEGMGFAGLVPSLGIEFDTYRNAHINDPAADHMALLRDGDPYHRQSDARIVELDNLEDGERHPLRITWEPADGQLKIFLDGAPKASYSAKIVSDIFGGQSVVYWGMTAGTGRLSNNQDVCIEKLYLARRPSEVR